MEKIVNWVRRHPLADLVVGLSVAVAVFAAVMLLNQPWASGGLEAERARLEALDSESLANEKLRQEILQLRAANLTAASPWGSLPSIVPVITAVLGGAAVFATIWKQMSDRADQARQDREERDLERQRRAAESFKSTTENLAAASPALRASAAATLSTFVRPEYSSYLSELVLVSVAKSKEGMEDNPAVIRLVTRAVELALRAALPSMTADDRRFYLDLSRCQLQRIDLSDLDLSGIDIAFADMREARLRGTNLYRVQGKDVRLGNARLGASERGATNLREARLRGAIAPEAQFHKAVCVSIRLEEADLRKAEFFDAKLQEAHFDDADLRGATFHGADLNNAYFSGAKLDQAALRSIATGALHWRDAHFDAEHLAELIGISEGTRPAGQAPTQPVAATPGGEPEGTPVGDAVDRLTSAAPDAPAPEEKPPLPGTTPA